MLFFLYLFYCRSLLRCTRLSLRLLSLFTRLLLFHFDAMVSPLRKCVNMYVLDYNCIVSRLPYGPYEQMKNERKKTSNSQRVVHLSEHPIKVSFFVLTRNTTVWVASSCFKMCALVKLSLLLWNMYISMWCNVLQIWRVIFE